MFVLLAFVLSPFVCLLARVVCFALFLFLVFASICFAVPRWWYLVQVRRCVGDIRFVCVGYCVRFACLVLSPFACLLCFLSSFRFALLCLVGGAQFGSASSLGVFASFA